jgi:hypothetical protein
MQRILFTMDSGKEYCLSSKVYGGNGPMRGSDAKIQLSLIVENLAYFSADDGTVLMVPHISSARTEEG